VQSLSKSIPLKLDQQLKVFSVEDVELVGIPDNLHQADIFILVLKFVFTNPHSILFDPWKHV